MPQLTQDNTTKLCTSILTRQGIADEDIAAILDHLMYNELCGKSSHGLVRIKWIVDGIQRSGLASGPPTLALDKGAVAIVDGHNNIGLIPCLKATKIAIQKARHHGIAFVGARNHDITTGSMSYYNRQVLEAGMIGIIGCNSGSLVAHPNGIDPVIGTNPISFAMPAETTVFLADVTTAAMSYGEIMVLKKKGKPLPLGMIIDSDGNPSQNHDDAINGAQLPMSGFKGFGLGLAVELLAGPLIGAKGSHNEPSAPDGFFIIVIDPAYLGDSKDICGGFEKVIQGVKASRPRADISEILIPGERSAQNLAHAKTKDMIDVDQGVYDELMALSGQEV